VTAGGAGQLYPGPGPIDPRPPAANHPLCGM